MDLFTKTLSERVAPDNALRKVEAAIDWNRVSRKAGNVRSQHGRSGYDVEMMIRLLLLGHWHSLSDRALEHAIRVRLDFVLFCGASVLDNCPDHTTICRFRNTLVRLGVYQAILEDVDLQLKERNLKIRNASAAVTNATVTRRTKRRKRRIGKVTVDRPGDRAVKGADESGKR